MISSAKSHLKKKYSILMRKFDTVRFSKADQCSVIIRLIMCGQFERPNFEDRATEPNA